jgi:O-antigen/teichoic acid export membrane protein
VSDGNDSPPAETSPVSLQEQAVRGVLWVALATGTTRALTFVTYLLLARILAPREFGVFAVATIVVNALLIFNDLGLGPAIVQNPGDRDTVASTALVVIPVLGAGIAGLSAVSASATARLLGDPGAAGVLRVLSLSIFFSSLAVVPSMLLEKDLAFRRQVVPQVLPAALFAVTAVLLAARTGAGAYSLAVAEVVDSVALAIGSWMACTWRPRWRFSWATARQLFRYGKHVLGGGVVLYLATNMDNAFVSRSAGQRALGIYVLAYLIANLPATEIADLAGRVLFPAFVMLDGRPEELRRAYGRSLTALTLVTLPLFVMLASLARPLVAAIFGHNWSGMVAPLRILPVFGAFRVLSGVSGNLFLAVNRPRYILLTGLVGLSLQAGLLWLFVVARHGGALGASVAVTIASGVLVWLIAALVGRVVKVTWASVVPRAGRLLAAGCLAAAAGLAVAQSPLPPVAQLAVGASCWCTGAPCSSSAVGPMWSRSLSFSVGAARP